LQNSETEGSEKMPGNLHNRADKLESGLLCNSQADENGLTFGGWVTIDNKAERHTKMRK
jgi:hypothetical protein